MKQSKHIIGIVFATIISVTGFAQPANASTLMFEPNNAALFPQANPSNNALMMASVVKPTNPNQAAALGQLTPSSIIEQSVLGQISSKINDQIFNSTPGTSGSFDLGSGNNISYTNVGGVITVNILQNGQVTSIQL